ncbi:MAG: glutaredoxin [Cellvibrionaceae bacterium]|mgnify:CR=1 FL=1|nr:glutaredoxin [Cellvibrionaceae bacterium]
MKTVTVYSKDYCPYCKAAKKLLNTLNVEFKEIDVLRSPVDLKTMRRRSNRHTVPQIFFGDKHIGGYTDLVDYLQDSRNKRALAS